MKLLSSSCLINKQDQLQVCILAPLYTSFIRGGLISASIFLVYCKRLYIYQLLSLLDKHLAKQVLLISPKIKDGSFYPKKLSDNTVMWTQTSRQTLYGQWVTRQIIVEYSINSTYRVEPVEKINPKHQYKREVLVKLKKQMLKKATKNMVKLVFGTNKPKVD